jgi:fido (protein-threonine AMPylation protein)
MSRFSEVMMSQRDTSILALLSRGGGLSSRDVMNGLGGTETVSLASVKRDLARLVTDGMVNVSGQGRATRYRLTPAGALLRPVDVGAYFEQEIDERQVRTGFNWDLFTTTLASVALFTPTETTHLHDLRRTFQEHIAELTPTALRKEQERLAVDLSWKSSQIEGNTYSLLETERLLKERLTADGKTKEEAVMLLNHKDAIDFAIDHPNYLSPLRVRGIEDVHRLLVKELDVDFGVRERRVGISGTNYVPLDNAFQIREALDALCALVNVNPDPFAKALLVLLLISYIQPFADGNKRTSRIVGNALLLADGCCPLSFRTVDSVYYKETLLVFYEQNAIAPFKQIFIDQCEFAVQTYF